MNYHSGFELLPPVKRYAAGMLLSAAMFGATLSCAQSSLPSAPEHIATLGRSVVITVDDLPGAMPGSDRAPGGLQEVEQINRDLLRVLKAHDVPALGLVNESKLQVLGERDPRTGILKAWIDAGMELGNHTYSHVHFSNVPLDQYEDDFMRGDVVVRSLMTSSGKQERYFRHPALDRGRDAAANASFEAFLERHGYQIAPVTVENADYKFNDVLAEALKAHDDGLTTTIKAQYLSFTQLSFDYVEDSSRKLFGREVPQVLLIHDSRLNAEMLDQLLTALEKHGYEFVSLDKALADPAYQPHEVPSATMAKCYLCWNNQLVVAGKSSGPSSMPRPPVWITNRFNLIRKATGE